MPVLLSIESCEATGDKTCSQAVSAPWQGSGTILLVEDELQVQLVAKAMLENMGFSVIEASNGQEALELYRKNAAEISLVISDIGMPVMDGYALSRELKLLKRDLPIISSGFGDMVVTRRIPSGEIAGLVSKPYRYDTLMGVLRGVVEEKKPVKAYGKSTIKPYGAHYFDVVFFQQTIKGAPRHMSQAGRFGDVTLGFFQIT